MKNIIYLLLLSSLVYSQCDYSSEVPCNQNEGCEWVEDIEIGNCSVFDNSESSCNDYPGECFWDEDITYASCNYPNSGSCNSVEGCYWDCSDYGWYCDCYGQQQIVDTECIGQYEIDNSYCQEVEMPECSEDEFQCNDQSCISIDRFCNGWNDCEDGSDEENCDNCLEFEQLECYSSNSCEWIEDIEYGSCSGLSQTQCNSGDAYGNCEWECIQYGWWYDWCYTYGCTGGTYEIDNGSCEEIPYELGDINGDLSVNVLDVIETVNLIIDGGYNIAVDIDSNGDLNVLDVIQIINIILEGETNEL